MVLSSMSKGGSLRACAYGWGGLATIILLCGVMLAMLDSDNLTKQLTAPSMVLTEGSLGMTMWMTPPSPVIFKVYFWNVTNPSDVLSGAKPKLIEVGPYIYEKTLGKVETVIEENDTLLYREHDNLVFSEDLTGQLRRETDMVTILHLPIMGMILRVYEIAPEYVSFLDGVWSSLFPTAEDIFMRGTVKDILFDGIPVDCHSTDFMVTTVCNNMEEDPPQTFRKVGDKDFRFSYFSHKKSVTSYTMRVYRGVEDLSRVKQIASFNDQVTINKWHNKYCDMLNGSDGSQFPPGLKPGDVIYMFEPDFCRSVYASYERELYFDGLQLLRFVNTADLFASAEENPNNECYCVPKAQLSDIMGGGEPSDSDPDEEPPPKTCLKSGAILLTPCVGAPLAMTFPHFYLADKSYSEYVDLSPTKELHETFVDVEPLTGTPVRGSKKIQFNMEVKAIQETPLLSNLTPGFFPILWVEETMEVTENVKSVLRKVQWVNRNVNTVGYILAALAGLLIIIIAICYKKSTGTWNGAEEEEEESREYDNHGYGLYGMYTNRTKMPIDGNGPGKTTGLVPDYPVLMRRNGGRIYPNNQHTISGLYAENFM